MDTKLKQPVCSQVMSAMRNDPDFQGNLDDYFVWDNLDRPCDLDCCSDQD